VNIGVIGWGLRKSIAKIAHQPENGISLVALADPDPKAQQDFIDFCGGKIVASHLDLKGLDAVFVLSPDHLHERHAVDLLGAGVPLYLEKPLAITVQGCDNILAASERTGTKLFAGHNMRYFGVVSTMRDWIAEGKIGEVKTAWCRHFVSYGGVAYFRDWHADRLKSTGLLLQKGAHDIDVLHWLCGSYTKRVSAMGGLLLYGDIKERLAPGEKFPAAFDNTWPPSTLKPLNDIVDVEDVSMMLMELESGALASYQQCHFTPDAWRNYTVIGSEGRIENFGDGPGEAVIKLWNKNRYGYAPDGDEEYQVPATEGTHGGADPLIVEEFFAFLREGITPRTSPFAGRMAVAAGVAATESIRDGSRPRDLPVYSNRSAWE
jgi:predicted dehydrogenase